MNSQYVCTLLAIALELEMCMEGTKLLEPSLNMVSLPVNRDHRPTKVRLAGQRKLPPLLYFAAKRCPISYRIIAMLRGKGKTNTEVPPRLGQP